MTPQFEQLAKEYAEKFPHEERIHNHLNEFGDVKLVEIMKKANGRKIIFEVDPTLPERALDTSHTVGYE